MVISFSCNYTTLSQPWIKHLIYLSQLGRQLIGELIYAHQRNFNFFSRIVLIGIFFTVASIIINKNRKIEIYK